MLCKKKKESIAIYQKKAHLSVLQCSVIWSLDTVFVAKLTSSFGYNLR